jgi:hypothetical protein
MRGIVEMQEGIHRFSFLSWEEGRGHGRYAILQYAKGEGCNQRPLAQRDKINAAPIRGKQSQVVIGAEMEVSFQ